MRAYWPSLYELSEWGDSVEGCVGDSWDTHVGKIAVFVCGAEKKWF